MIRAFHAISTLLCMAAIGFLLLNLVWQFAAHGQIKVLSIEELWKSIDKSSLESVRTFVEPHVSANGWALFIHAPAAGVLAAIAAALYLPVRILMFFGFGRAKDWWR